MSEIPARERSVMTAEQENAYIEIALHDIEERRGRQRESVQVFREFYRAIKAAMESSQAHQADATTQSYEDDAQGLYSAIMNARIDAALSTPSDSERK